jgi:16S rRNA (uracil1498-N3)-methyltransferase
VRTERLQIIAREAAEQTERFDAPEIVEAEPLAKALDGWDHARTLIYADEAGDDAEAAWGGDSGRAPPILQELALLPRWGREHDAGPPAEDTDGQEPREGAAKLALLIGPEGGFTEEERRMLRGLTFVTPVSLGPRILRAETAVIGALSIIQAAWGDWRPA